MSWSALTDLVKHVDPTLANSLSKLRAMAHGDGGGQVSNRPYHLALFGYSPARDRHAHVLRSFREVSVMFMRSLKLSNV